MRSKSEILKTGILIGILMIVVGIGAVIVSGALGASFEELYSGRHYYENEPVLPFFLVGLIAAIGIISVFIGVIAPFIYFKEWGGGTPIKQNGRIVEIVKRAKNGDMVVLTEFSDGQRKELIASKKLYLSAGDYGFIGAQGKHLVYFKRGQ